MYIIVAYHRNTLNLARYIGPFPSRMNAESFVQDVLENEAHLVFEVAPLFAT